MKRTSASMLNASAGRLRGAGGLTLYRRAWWTAVFLACGGLMFVLGRGSAGLPQELQQEIARLQLEIHAQQGIVDRLIRDNERSVNALAARLAELQAASTRLDAMGLRLAQMGQLTLDEFDFSEPVPVGGPDVSESIGAAAGEDLRITISALGEKLRRQSSQLDALQSLMVNRQLESDLTPTGWPVRKGWISSRFGERNDPFTGERVMHRGLDFAGTQGTEVLSVASGVVIWAAPRAAYGQAVEIDHGNGYRTRYAHNEKVTVRAGDHVSAGQVIGLMGSTGRASAPHVHFEVLKDGARINPARYVDHLR